MTTPPTAFITFDITGRTRGGVRVNPPAAGKSSFRILWTDDDGRQRERNHTSLEGAENLAESIAHDLVREQTPTVSTDPTLGDLLDHYLHGAGRPTRWTSVKSARRPEQIARRILTAQDLAVRSSAYCSPAGIGLLQDIMNRAARAGCTPGGSEYEKAGGLLKTLFDVAERDTLTVLPNGNPVAAIRYRLDEFASSPSAQMLNVRYIGPELRPPTDRVRDFIDATEQMFGSREARYVEVRAFGGLRPGEANALRPDGLRTDHPGLLVTRQLLELTAKEAKETEDGKTQQFCLPKWSSVRNAYYPSDLLERLFELADRERLGPHDVLFPSSRGELRRQGNWRRDVFSPVAKRVGWPTTQIYKRDRMETHWVWPSYAFRHHYANFLLKDLNQPLVAVAQFMGHRNTKVTERMYLKTELADLDNADRTYLEYLTGRAAS